MEQETRKFAIEQAVKLIGTMPIDNKQKAVFDFADDIVKYIQPNQENTFVGEYSWVAKMDTLEQTK